MLAAVCEMVLVAATIACAPPTSPAEAEWLLRQRSPAYSESRGLSVGITLDTEGKTLELTSAPFMVMEGETLWPQVVEQHPAAVAYMNSPDIDAAGPEKLVYERHGMANPPMLQASEPR